MLFHAHKPQSVPVPRGSVQHQAGLWLLSRIHKAESTGTSRFPAGVLQSPSSADGIYTHSHVPACP